ncbi:MAG: copper amine oxidase N-terminal domain-containing protein [Bacillota bacterium]
MRKLLVAFFAILLTAWPAAAVTSPGGTVSVEGLLTWSMVESPHYELATGGQTLVVLEHPDYPDAYKGLEAYLNRRVLLTGEISTQPNIYMRGPLLRVTAVEAAGAAGTEPAAVFFIGVTHYRAGQALEEMDAAPYLKERRAYVPIRYLARALGVAQEDITWDGERREAHLRHGAYTLVLKPGSPDLAIQGPQDWMVVRMEAAPEIVDGRLMAPARWVAERLGYRVTWDAKLCAVVVENPAVPSPAGAEGGPQG